LAPKLAIEIQIFDFDFNQLVEIAKIKDGGKNG